MLYHLEDIEKIREFEKNIEKKGGKAIDLSHWDPGSNYNKLLMSKLEMPVLFEPLNYLYSYEFEKESHKKVEEKLIGETHNECSVFFANSTIAIVNICNFLQKNRLKNVCVLQPSYFTVGPCMESFGLNVNYISLINQNGKFIIPIKQVLSYEFDVVWITSPVFCASTYFDEEEIKKIQYLLNQNIFIVCDESLSIPKYNLRQKLVNTDKLFNIYSPHKVISTNTIKFSCLICCKKYEDFFDQWTDLFSGGLSNSTKIAIEHFLSSNYVDCLNLHVDYTNEIKNVIAELLRTNVNYRDIFYSHSVGQYMTVFCPFVPYIESTKQDFIKELIYKTEVSILPGYLEGFLEEFGFCFRINLTLNKSTIIPSLNKVLLYLYERYS